MCVYIYIYIYLYVCNIGLYPVFIHRSIYIRKLLHDKSNSHNKKNKKIKRIREITKLKTVKSKFLENIIHTSSMFSNIINKLKFLQIIYLQYILSN